MKKQMFKRVGSVALSGALLSGVIFTSAFAAESSSTIKMSDLAAGTATAVAGDTVTISNQTELDKFVTWANNSKNETKGITFSLEASDLTLTKIIAPAVIGSNSTTNSPMYSSGVTFDGTFDGNDNTLELDLEFYGQNGAGMFGCIGTTGTVTDLNLTGKVSDNGSSSANGLNAVGSVAGYNCGVINDVSSDVTISTTGSVYNVGGIAGFNDNYYTKGAVGTIRNCTNTGSVSGYEKVGGIVGQNAGIVAACGNSGTIKTTATRKAGVGGIVGRNGNNDTAIETGTIVNCWNIGEVNVGSASWGGGIAGFSNSLSKIAYCYSAGTLVTTSTGSTGSLKFYDTGYICGDLEGSASNCYAEEQDDYATMEIADDGAKVLDAADMTDGTLLNYLRAGDTAYALCGMWSAETGEYPVCTGASVTADAASGWSTDTDIVYLNGTASTNGTGTMSSPYNNLSDAVTAANGGTVYITGTVTLDAGSYFDAVTFKPGPGLGSNYMFKVTTGTVTFGSATIEGTTTTNVFQVTGGNLRLRSGLKITSSNIAVDIANGGTATVNYTTIKATKYSFQVANGGKLIWCDFGSSGSPTINVTGNVYLASGAYITVWDSIYSAIKVNSEETKSGTEIAVGSGYTLTSSDLGCISMVGGQALTLNTTANTITIG